MWQDLNPELWWDGKSSLAGDGVPETFLKPFHDNSAGGKWNSDKARYWRESCGYLYPELQPWLPKYQKDEKDGKDKSIDRKLYRLDIRVTINNPYGTTRALVLEPPKSLNSQLPIVGNSFEQNDYVVIASYEKYDKFQKR